MTADPKLLGLNSLRRAGGLLVETCRGREREPGKALDPSRTGLRVSHRHPPSLA